MKYPLLTWILDQEAGQIHLSEHRWRPTDLLYVSQAQLLLRDIATRYKALREAQPEIQQLDRAFQYIRHLDKMRVSVRHAKYTWKGDQLVFMRSVAGFYVDYAAVLRLLKQDRARGLLIE